MCNKCGIIITRFEIVKADHNSASSEDLCLECIRPVAHDGPHLIQRHTGEYVAWEEDMGCTCQDCLSEYSEDWCILFGIVSDEEAKLLIESATRGSPHKDVVDDYLLPQHQSDWSEEDSEE